MAKIVWRAGTLLAPVPPVLVSCGTLEKPNVMTAAWTGTIASDPVITYVSVRPSRYSHHLIKESGEFVINLAAYNFFEAVDYCGVKSGCDTDKFKQTGLTPIASNKVSAPQIEQSPISLECKLLEIKNYGSHDMFVAEVVAVDVDDKYIEESGALNLDKAGLLAFAHGHYYTLGRNLGKLGFSVNKKYIKQKQKKLQKKRNNL